MGKKNVNYVSYICAFVLWRETKGKNKAILPSTPANSSPCKSYTPSWNCKGCKAMPEPQFVQFCIFIWRISLVQTRLQRIKESPFAHSWKYKVVCGVLYVITIARHLHGRNRSRCQHTSELCKELTAQLVGDAHAMSTQGDCLGFWSRQPSN